MRSIVHIQKIVNHHMHWQLCEENKPSTIHNWRQAAIVHFLLNMSLEGIRCIFISVKLDLHNILFGCKSQSLLYVAGVWMLRGGRGVVSILSGQSGSRSSGAAVLSLSAPTSGVAVEPWSQWAGNYWKYFHMFPSLGCSLHANMCHVQPMCMFSVYTTTTTQP